MAKVTVDKSQKEIIYLDTIELYSSLAQLDHGLIESIQSGNQKSNKQGDATETSGEIKGSIAGFITGDVQLSNSDSQEKVNSEQELVNITFKDYQLNRLLNKIGIGKLNNNATEGQLTLKNGSFQIFDFLSLANLSGNSFSDFMTSIMALEAEDNYISKEDVNSVKGGIETINKYGKVMNNLLPNTILLKVQQSISFLKADCLRMSNSQLQLLSGSKRRIHVLGIIENSIANENRQLDSLFDKIGENPSLVLKFVPDFIDYLLMETQIAHKNDKLIKPVAVYF